MPNSDSIRIRIPWLNTKPFKQVFLVVGVAKGDKIRSVKGTITSLKDSKKTDGKQVFFVDTDAPGTAQPADAPPKGFTKPPIKLRCGHPYLWALSFGTKDSLVDIGGYSLTVTGQDAKGSPVLDGSGKQISANVGVFLVGRAGGGGAGTCNDYVPCFRPRCHIGSQ